MQWYIMRWPWPQDHNAKLPSWFSGTLGTELEVVPDSFIAHALSSLLGIAGETSLLLNKARVLRLLLAMRMSFHITQIDNSVQPSNSEDWRQMRYADWQQQKKEQAKKQTGRKRSRREDAAAAPAAPQTDSATGPTGPSGAGMGEAIDITSGNSANSGSQLDAGSQSGGAAATPSAAQAVAVAQVAIEEPQALSWQGPKAAHQLHLEDDEVRWLPGLPIRFAHIRTRTYKPMPGHHICLADVLHYTSHGGMELPELRDHLYICKHPRLMAPAPIMSGAWYITLWPQPASSGNTQQAQYDENQSEAVPPSFVRTAFEQLLTHGGLLFRFDRTRIQALLAALGLRALPDQEQLQRDAQQWRLARSAAAVVQARA